MLSFGVGQQLAQTVKAIRNTRGTRVLVEDTRQSHSGLAPNGCIWLIRFDTVGNRRFPEVQDLYDNMRGLHSGLLNMVLSDLMKGDAT